MENKPNGGKILFLGCGTEPNTSMHGVEELSEPPYLFSREQTLFTIEDSDGIRYEAWHRTHDFKGFRQRYDRISDYLNGSEVRYGKIMEADCCVMDAEALWSRGSAVLREDPYAFVERIK
ncbi:MAG: AAC(3) family N-acetyltransferase [Saccharofermentanales bacterium]